MAYILIDNISFDSNCIKVIERVHCNNTYGIDYYCNIGNTGRVFHADFQGFLREDNKASKIAYEFIVCYIINKTSGLINIDILMKSVSELYDKIIDKFAQSTVNIEKLQKLKDLILKEYFNSLLKLAEQTLI